MKNNKYLFEIGVEELPADYIKPAIDFIDDYFSTQLTRYDILFNHIYKFSTPRRLCIKITGLPEKQKNSKKEIIGPPKNISYTNGKLNKVGLGFIKSQNLSEKDIKIKILKKGEYLSATKYIEGEKTTNILKKISSEVIKKVTFPKTMRWDACKLSFARPVRWLMALFNNMILNFTIDGIETNRYTYGNRFEKIVNKIKIPNCEQYTGLLEKHFVIPERDKRHNLIYKQIHNLLKNKGITLIKDEKLLDNVTDLVEFPTSVLSSYDKKFLTLPFLIVKSTLNEHQKYFAIKDNNDKLVNQFIFVSNGSPDKTKSIKFGNESVINARLEDAEFFYTQDTKIPFPEFIPKLEEILFQARIGNMLEKTHRIEKLVQYINSFLNLSDKIKENSLRAAKLCKADLATMMLGEKEFTDLQGYVGYVYAKKSGENLKVAKAIWEHYYFENCQLKKMSIEGALVSIADKVDTICGIFGVGMFPTGSKDPFALRRAANCILQIMDFKKLELNLSGLIDYSFSLMKNKLEIKNKKNVYDFFKQRIRWLLTQKQIDYDVINSVVSTDLSNIPDLIIRAKTLQNFKFHDNFRKLIIGFKRASNILSSSKLNKKLRTELFKYKEEYQLYEKLNQILPKYRLDLKKNNYKSCLETLVTLKEAIDNFFDNVLVMVEDGEIRENRMALLRIINKSFLKIADLSQIVYEKEE